VARSIASVPSKGIKKLSVFPEPVPVEITSSLPAK
jgi:hypothetical protein